MKTYSCGLNWFGPFTNIQQVKEWEDSNGNDTYLYLIRGKKKYAKKVRASYGGTGDRSVSYPFFSGYERDEAFPQDTDLSPVPLFRGTAKYF